MLQEILLSLSGHPSPLLSNDHPSGNIISPAEKALLASVAHLSDVHRKLIRYTKDITASHPSSICQAVAASISSKHLADFRRKVVDVESGILRKDAGSVGAYNIVPLTSVVGEFMEWSRRMDWFWEIVQFMVATHDSGHCTGAQIINRLCEELHTGYDDIEDVANQLVKAAEAAWLKQVSAWVLHGRLPSFGAKDFGIYLIDAANLEFGINDALMPSFVSTQAANSMLFIGRSLNQIHVKGMAASAAASPEVRFLQSHLGYLARLSFPISSSSFSSAISGIRKSLSQIVLEQMLPLSKTVETLCLLREFFLLGRGEFAVALVAEADEKTRSRWKRAENMSHNKREGLGAIEVKEGEVSAVLTKTWAAMRSAQGDHGDEEDMLELASDLIELHLDKPQSSITPLRPTSNRKTPTLLKPFSNLLFSAPVSLTLKILSPLDLFLGASDIRVYTRINSYLLSIRRAHLRLTGLWKITSLRRDHPAPLGPPFGSTLAGRATVLTHRRRIAERSRAIRSVWATSSAAVFFLGETEAYLQGEVIQSSWEGFQRWLQPDARPSSSTSATQRDMHASEQGAVPKHRLHDPQSLADAHRLYLRSLSQHLLVNIPSFTDPLLHLLQQLDHLVALVERIHAIWQSLDLETDAGVIDAFSDFHQEESEVKEQLRIIARRVKDGIAALLAALRDIDQRNLVVAEDVDREDALAHAALDCEDDVFVPQKVGDVSRLLMKLDFGGWFDDAPRGVDELGDADF